ncbi:Non-specific lipid-transfer protein AP10 [Morella rubra]|uniref:Non-specific lipid-transfer protein AP10 n=1 Tax=Morella rubra TaxID=262757 RepID=A0A6A1W957_9ROSI|nr:Non-specific lipid-transfer protein AP10 [Morella rubra]
MQKMMGCAILAFGLMIIVVTATAPPSQGIACNDALKDLGPCQSFLVASGPATTPPTSDCCQGAASVMKQATTTDTRKSLCVCFKDAGKNMKVNADRAKSLPKLCNLNVPVPIDPNVNCDT